jgi:Domain of unknown function (DUF4360)
MLTAVKCLLVLFIVIPTTAVWGLLLDDEQPDQMNSNSFFAPFQLDDEPTFFGSGCLDGSVEILIPDFGQEDNDSTIVTVLFSQYMVSTLGPILNADMSCSMDLPVHVEPGRSVGIFQIDYRGYAYVPAGEASFARFDTEYFFAGLPGPKLSRTYNGDEGGVDGVFSETDIIENVVWSECGGTTDFRITTSLIASKPTAWDLDVFISLDSKDINSDGFYVTFASRPC